MLKILKKKDLEFGECIPRDALIVFGRVKEKIPSQHRGMFRIHAHFLVLNFPIYSHRMEPDFMRNGYSFGWHKAAIHFYKELKQKGEWNLWWLPQGKAICDEPTFISRRELHAH